MRQPTLLPDILRRRAVQETDRTAYIFLDDNGAETSTLTYGELHARALSVAAELETRCAPGDRALLVFPQCPEFIVAWFGCLYAGVIAVPVHPPRRARVQEATVSIVRDCVPVAVLSLDMFLAPLRTVLYLLRRTTLARGRRNVHRRSGIRTGGPNRGRSGLPAIHLRLHLRAQGRHGHARQSDGQRGDDPAGLRP